MTRSEVLERINELMSRKQQLDQTPASTTEEKKAIQQAAQLLEDWRKDLQAIYYTHLYKLP